MRRRRVLLPLASAVFVASAVSCSETADGAARETPAATIVLDRPPTARRVWSGPAVNPTLRPSFDGARIAYIDPATGDVALHGLANRTDRRLTTFGGRGATGDFFDTPVTGPDGRRIAFSSWSGTSDRLELGIVDATGRRLGLPAGSESMVPVAWSRDGTRLAVGLPRRNAVTELGVVDTTGAVVTLPGGARFVAADGHIQFARDARTLLADVRQAREPSDSFDVVGIDVATGRSWSVVTGPADDRLAGLTADGQVVLFLSDREGTTSLYGQPVTPELQPVGPPLTVRRDLWSAAALGTTADGSLLYTIQTGVETLQSVQLDLASGAASAPRIIGTAASAASVAAADWTADGLSTVQNFRPGRGRGAHVLSVRSVLSGEMREVGTPLTEITALQASPAGTRVLVNGRDDRNRIGVYLVDLATGATDSVAYASFDTPAMVRAAGWSSDSRTAFYTIEDFHRDRLRLVAHDVSTHVDRNVLELPCTMNCIGRASPDGRSFAIVQRDPGSPTTTRLLTVTADNAAPRELARFEAPDRLSGAPAWTPDGQSLIIALGTSDDASGRAARFVIAHADATPATIATAGVTGPVTGVRVHPNGREILFLSGRTAFELWSLGPLRFRPSR